MPISPFLALNIRSGVTPILKRYVNSTPSDVGVTFGALDNNAGAGTASFLRGYVPTVKFGGSQTFLATVGNQVYRSTNGGASWLSVYTMATLSGTIQCAKSGLWVIPVAGVSTAVIVWSDGSLNFYAATSTTGNSWTTHGPFLTPVSGPLNQNWNFTDVVVWDGKLLSYIHSPGGGGNSDFYLSSLYDPQTSTMSFALLTPQGFHANVFQTGSVCVYNDRLFGLESEDGGTQLYELVAGTWVFNQVIDASAGAPGRDCKESLFTDGTNLYAFSLRNGGGWRCYQFNSSLVKTDITASVIPAAILTAPNTSKLQVIIDDRAVPGTTPTIWAMYAIDGTSSSNWSQFQWQGPGSLMTFVETGGDSTHGMPFVKHAQGTTYWTSGENFVQIVSSASAIGGLTIGFTLYSDTGTGTASVRAWQGTATAAYPLSAATLTGTTTGLPLDNTTINTVVWHAQTDGFSSGQRAKFVMEQF